MCKKHYKIVFVLGVAVKKENNGNFVLADQDKGGPLLGEWRLKAVKKILEEKMADKIVIVSWKQNIEGEEVWRCEVMQDLLIKNYKVDPELVEVRKQSEEKTMGNGVEIKRYLFDYSIRSDECAFLTNFYHIPRTSAIFQEIGLFLRPLAAESFFVCDENKIWEDYGQKNFTFFDRLIKEMKGMKSRELD